MSKGIDHCGSFNPINFYQLVISHGAGSFYCMSKGIDHCGSFNPLHFYYLSQWLFRHSAGGFTA